MPYRVRFCSNCGSDNIIEEVPEGDNRERVICADCRFIHYSNPRIVAGCLPLWQNRVLLCRRDIEPRRGFWNLPCGYLEDGETVAEGATREVFEEARAEVHIEQLQTVYSIPHIDQVYIIFLAQIKNGIFKAGEESSEAELFSEEEIPWDEIAFSSSAFALENYFRDRNKDRIGTHYSEMSKDLKNSF